MRKQLVKTFSWVCLPKIDSDVRNWWAHNRYWRLSKVSWIVKWPMRETFWEFSCPLFLPFPLMPYLIPAPSSIISFLIPFSCRLYLFDLVEDCYFSVYCYSFVWYALKTLVFSYLLYFLYISCLDLHIFSLTIMYQLFFFRVENFS